MGLIQWDGIYGESDTFVPEADVAAAIKDAEKVAQEHPYNDSSSELPDLDRARRQNLPHRSDAR